MSFKNVGEGVQIKSLVRPAEVQLAAWHPEWSTQPFNPQPEGNSNSCAVSDPR